MMSGLPALIIEDSVEVADFLSLVLKEAEYEVVNAYNGRQAIDHLGSLSPHLILLDLGLPDIHGTELLKTIRATETAKSAWIIVITGQSEYIDYWLKDNVDFGLIKPVDYIDLLHLVQRLQTIKK